jgi:restriction system protein
MARRGFFAELHYQSRLAAKRREREEREASVQYRAAVRAAEQARKAEEQAQARLSKASEAERRRLEKELRDAHVASIKAEVEARNGKLAQVHSEVNSLLASTLVVDDFVDLRSLQSGPVHPPFARPDLEVPMPPPVPLPDPVRPAFVLPRQPTGLASLFGKKKHADALAAAKRDYENAMEEWRQACWHAQAQRQAAEHAHALAEARRIESLERERRQYASECELREAEAAERNKRLDELIASLGYGTPEAIQEYVSIVLSNSVYPEHFLVTHKFAFDPESAELSLQALVPAPGEIPEIKSYKYDKAGDNIVAIPLSQKQCRDQYASAVHQVALRSFHEVFEADRQGLVKTISLEVGANAIDPATGQPTHVPFVIAAAEREAFMGFDLLAVVPAQTLARLGASVSNNPYGLIAATRSGVRRS